MQNDGKHPDQCQNSINPPIYNSSLSSHPDRASNRSRQNSSSSSSPHSPENNLKSSSHQKSSTTNFSLLNDQQKFYLDMFLSQHIQIIRFLQEEHANPFFLRQSRTLSKNCISFNVFFLADHIISWLITSFLG